MTSDIAVDKAKWHSESVEEYGLPSEHSAHHIAFFLKWCIERDFVNSELQKMQLRNYEAVKTGEKSVVDYLLGFDGVFASNMLTPMGAAFSDFYFHIQNGQYLSDLEKTLQRSLPSIYHIDFNDENYAVIKAVIDHRFSVWREILPLHNSSEEEPLQKKW